MYNVWNRILLFLINEGQKRQDGEATFFILYNILFVAKMLCTSTDFFVCYNEKNPGVFATLVFRALKQKFSCLLVYVLFGQLVTTVNN